MRAKLNDEGAGHAEHRPAARTPHRPPGSAAPLCWPFPPGSQNHTDKAVKLKPYTPPKRRSLNQF